MARRAKTPDFRLTDLFLDMLAAERGAAANTLIAYRGDLEDFATHVGGTGATVATATGDDIRAYLGALASSRSTSPIDRIFGSGRPRRGPSMAAPGSSPRWPSA